MAKDFENRLRAGGLGYGDLKKALFENYWNYFAEARKKRAELAANLDHVNKVLADGAAKARAMAQEVLKRARKAGGWTNSDELPAGAVVSNRMAALCAVA